MPVGNPQKGEIWKECDPRMERYVRIVEIWSSGQVIVQRIDRVDGQWTNVCVERQNARGVITRRASQRRQADAARFDGKRGGYEFYMEAL